MAKLVYINTTFSGMNGIPLSPGQILYCADVPMTYYDTTGGKRVVFDKIKYCYAESDRMNLSVASLKNDYLYCVTSNGKFYRWSLATDWDAVTYTADIYDLLDISEFLVPTILRNNDGTAVAPKTLAVQVFTQYGEKVEDILNDITRIGKTYRYLEVESDKQTEYELPLPFANYFGLGNYIEVYLDSEWISPTRYTIEVDDDQPSPTTAKLLFNEAEAVLTAGKEITVIYTYNIARVKGGVYGGVDGHYIVDKTIPITKLDKYSSDFRLDDASSVATNKAVFSTYEVLNSKLNAIAGNLIAHAISYNTGSELKTDIENFTLVDNSTIYLKLHTDIMPGATLSVNGAPPIPIYLNYKDPIKAGLKEGDVMSLTYSKLNNKFFVNASVAYKLLHYRYVYECHGGESTIAIDIADFEPGYDNLHVSHNNLKLIEGINYNIDGHNLVLTYNAEAGDIIEMEMDKVSGNGLPMNGNTIMEDISFIQDVILKGDVIFHNNITFPNGGYVTENGDMYIGGDISTINNISGSQIISTVEDGIPPLIIGSTTLVENLNADMVDGYHAVDLAIPDESFKLIIDGETDVIEPNVQLILSSFYSRIGGLNNRMMTTDAVDTIEPNRQYYDDIIPPDYTWPENEPLSSPIIRSTVEDIIYEMDKLNFRIVATESTEDNNISGEDINEMDGTEIEKTDYVAPEQYELLLTWGELVQYIDLNLYDMELRMVKVANIDDSEEDINATHEQLLAEYKAILEEYSNGSSGATSSQEVAIKAMYLLNQEKRFYPVTHKNAVIGLPFGEVATVKSVEKAEKVLDSHNHRLEYLEEVIERLISGDTTGDSQAISTGKLVMLRGFKIPVYNAIQE